MNKLIWILIATFAGALMPFQGGVNSLLSRHVNSSILASFFSFAGGTILLFLYALLTRQTVSWEGIRSAPWYAWLGGACGAFALTAIILCMPRLGPGVTVGLIVAGQM